MTREEFFQRAMLMMAEKIMDRADKQPKPEELAGLSKVYAKELHDHMMAGLTELDIVQELAGKPLAPPVLRERAPVDDVPVLGKNAPAPVALPAMTCTECGRPMRPRNGRYGPFYGCSGFPSCKAVVKPKENSSG